MEGKRTYLAYVSEGLGKSQDWEMVLKYQRKNGSLSNSPSTTAAAFTHLKNSGCLSYLQSLLDKFGDAVSPSTLVYSFLCIFSNISNFSNSYLDILNFNFFFQFQTVYPLDIYSRLCMVDSLEMLGIDRHFRKEIRSVLDETYRKCHF